MKRHNGTKPNSGFSCLRFFVENRPKLIKKSGILAKSSTFPEKMEEFPEEIAEFFVIEEGEIFFISLLTFGLN